MTAVRTLFSVMMANKVLMDETVHRESIFQLPWKTTEAVWTERLGVISIANFSLLESGHKLKITGYELQLNRGDLMALRELLLYS